MKSNRERGGGEENITYSNIKMDGVKNPISITSYYPKTPKNPTDDAAKDIAPSTPSWKHVYLKNITVLNAENAGTIWGLPELSISDVVFDNVQVFAAKAMNVNFAKGIVFKNGSALRVSQDVAIKSYQAEITGMDQDSGKPK
jgi:polygalacturonase